MDEHTALSTRDFTPMDQATRNAIFWTNLKNPNDGRQQWVLLNLCWNWYAELLGPQVYYSAAKFVVKKFGATEGRRVRANLLTPEQYYNVCKIMAKQGVFTNLDYGKLQMVARPGLENPVRDIILTLSKNIRNEETREELFNYLLKNKDIYSAILESMQPQAQNLREGLQAYATAYHM